MKENGIKSKRKPKWKKTTNSKHDLPIAPNLLNQDFNIKTPNTVWVGDITYNWTEEGWLYTAIVKDLCTKDIVGYAMGDRITKELAIKAITPSMSRKGNPYDNAVAENFFSNMKC